MPGDARAATPAGICPASIRAMSARRAIHLRAPGWRSLKCHHPSRSADPARVLPGPCLSLDVMLLIGVTSSWPSIQHRLVWRAWERPAHAGHMQPLRPPHRRLCPLWRDGVSRRSQCKAIVSCARRSMTPPGRLARWGVRLWCHPPPRPGWAGL